MTSGHDFRDCPLFAACPVPMWVYAEATQKFLDVNEAAVRHYGYTREEFLSMTLADIRPAEELPAFLNRARSIGVLNKAGVWRHRKRSGEVIFVEIVAFSTTYEALPARIVIASDVTKEVAAGALFPEVGAAISQNAIPPFFAQLIHEIRTPLNSIVSSVSLLETTELDQDQLDYVSFASSATTALLTLANDFLDYSKVSAGALTLNVVECSPREIAERAVKIVAAELTRRGLTFRVEVGPGVPDTIMGDANRISQVLLNFLSNALKFTVRGGVVARVLRCEDRTSWVRFEIEDSGIGVREEYKERVFEIFTSEDSKSAHQFGGTGLGLSLCKKLVNLMGGDIGLMSKVGEGTTFWLELPVGAGTIQ